MRVLLLGATGTIGRAAARALVEKGHRVVAPVRPGSGAGLPAPVEPRPAEVTRAGAIAGSMRGERFDAVLSCLASRTGRPRDAWAVDHGGHVAAIEAAREAGIPHMVMLSAICVQKPRLAFQHAKLAAEAALIGSGLGYSIVRPTAFFKSLSGQIGRVREGKPFLIFGDGRRTACKPISDRDLAHYLVDCLSDPARADRVLPIGGPGPAVSPREQGEWLFELTGRAPRFRSVPAGLLGAAAAVLGALGMRGKAEFARIGQYYATESMLVWDGARYDAAATPETGSDRLKAHYARVLAGEAAADRGDHAFFA